MNGDIMKINYNEIDDYTRLQIADTLSKIEAVKSELADIQTEKALIHAEFTIKENNLNAEINRLTQNIRKDRKATVNE